MKILINKETGIPMFPMDQLLLDPSCKACYDLFGIHGLHYAILFGWEGSPYKSKSDPENRHDLVYNQVKDLDLYDSPKQRLVLAKNAKITLAVKGNAVINKAINSMNTLAPVPILGLRNYYMAQLEKTKNILDKVVIKHTDSADLIKKTADTQSVLSKQIREYQKALKEIDDEIEAMFNQEKHVDLYDLIKAVQ